MDPNRLARREFMAAGAAASLLAASHQSALAAAGSDYRVAVIGHTGRGDYGHGLDRVWLDVPGTAIVAVADAHAAGLRAAEDRLGRVRGFADYRKMLDEVRPDFVSVCPRWLDQHCDMVVAAAQRGVRGIYLEKPMCRSLAEADRMLEACEQSGTKLAIATQTRYSPKIKILETLIQGGQLGRIVEIRTRGKEDHRGGGEDLWVLGTHVLDLMRHFGGDPQSCFASVHENGKPVTGEDVKPGNEGIGPLAGDEVHATYRLTGGATGYFDSVRNTRGQPSRFGIQLFGTEGVLELFNTGYLPTVNYLAESAWSAGRGGQWLPVSSRGIGQTEPLPPGGLHEGNVVAVQDLIAAVEEDRQPVTNIYEARQTVEMIAAVFESHRQGRPVPLPLKNRQNALAMLA